MSQTKVTREQLEARFASLQAGVEGQVDSKKKTIAIGGGIAALILLLLFFSLGKRSGKKKTTIVEIRRV